METESKERKTILVVDDEQDLREALFTVLAADGFEVLVAEDGAEALSLAFKHKPDLILLDLRMPNVDGHEVLQRLHDDEWGSTVKIIVLTVLSDLETVSKTIERGGLEYLIKNDWKLADIVKRVQERLKE